MTKIINVDAPSFARYSQLNSTYSQTLTCPCLEISINYDKFLNVQYKLHQVCSSIFVNQSWIDYLIHPNSQLINVRDFQLKSPSIFQALRTLCELLNRTINDSLTRFYSNQYVSGTVIPQEQFDFETEILIKQFRLSMKNSFVLFLSMIRNTTEVNALHSALLTNYYIHVTENNDILTLEQRYVRCSCASSSTCIDQSFISKNFGDTILFLVSGFYTGCYVIEALLLSNLECLYDQQCIDKLRSFLNVSLQMNITALDTSLPSVYLINSTIQELVDNLMIE